MTFAPQEDCASPGIIATSDAYVSEVLGRAMEHRELVLHAAAAAAARQSQTSCYRPGTLEVRRAGSFLRNRKGNHRNERSFAAQ